MAYKSDDKLWRSEFYNNVSEKDRVQVKNLNQLKFKVNVFYKKDENINTNFEGSDDEDVLNEAYPDKNLSKREHQITYLEKKIMEFKQLSNKQSVQDVLNQRTVKTTIQTLYDIRFFDDYNNADEVLKDFLVC